MSSKIEYRFNNCEKDIIEAQMTTTKPNGDELIVLFAHDSGSSYDEFTDSGCTWCHPNVTIKYVTTNQESKVIAPRKVFGISFGKPQTTAADVRDSRILYQAHIYSNNVNTEQTKYLDDLLRSFEKTKNAQTIIDKIDPEFKPIVEQALTAMLHGGLSDALMQKTKAKEKAKKSEEEKKQAFQQQRRNDAALANSFMR